MHTHPLSLTHTHTHTHTNTHTHTHTHNSQWLDIMLAMRSFGSKLVENRFVAPLIFLKSELASKCTMKNDCRADFWGISAEASSSKLAWWHHWYFSKVSSIDIFHSTFSTGWRRLIECVCECVRDRERENVYDMYMYWFLPRTRK